MGIRFDGHPNLTPDHHGRRLGGPPAAQGLSDRRRARPLLRGGVGGRPPSARRSTRDRASPRRPRPCSRCPDAPRLRGLLQINFGPNHPSTHGVLRLDRRPRRRARRRPPRGHRLPAHGLREEHGAEDVVEGDHVPGADRLRLLPEQRARLRARDREAARDRGPARRRPGCGCCSAS